jgi:hypothetical protein
MERKPASKEQLLQAIKEERKNLERSLKGLSHNDMMLSPSAGEWSIQDIMAHITAWEQTCLNWYSAGLRGDKVDIPNFEKPGIVDEINLGIYKRNKDRWLKEIKKEFKQSYKEFYKTVKSMSEEDLFTPGKVPWTREFTLADYVMSNSNRHYAEHIPMIEALKQKLGKQ